MNTQSTPSQGARGPLVFSAHSEAHRLASKAGFASAYVGDILTDGQTSLPLGIIEQIEAARRAERRLVCLALHQGDPGIDQIFDLFRSSRLDPAWLEIAIFRADQIHGFVMSELERVINGWPVGRGPGGILPETRLDRHDDLIFKLACEVESLKTKRALPEGIRRLGDFLGEAFS